jgi:type I restriction enzyme S subunit
MSGETASDHVIRIAPKHERISAGYLYTYLSLRELGYPIILRTATGACIPALWPLYLNKLRVLRPTAEFNERIDRQVREAFEMRVQATELDDQARNTLEEALANAAK